MHFNKATQRRQKSYILVLFAAIYTGTVVIESIAEVDTPYVLIKKMSSAFKEQTYEGRFFFLNGNHVRSVRIVHGVFDGVERERLVHLDGKPSEIIRTGREIVCVHDGEEVDRLEQILPGPSISQRFSGQDLESYYELSLAGEDRVAGRSAQRVQLKPRDRNRFGYVLWLDKESGLLLKSVLFDEVGKPIEIFEFSVLKVGGPIDPKEFQPQLSGQSIVKSVKRIDTRYAASPTAMETVAASEHGEEESVRDWRVNWLPLGYSRSVMRVRRVEDKEGYLYTLMYTDGLSAFTLFFEQDVSAESLPPVTRKGATVAISRMVNNDKPTFLVTIVGELPEPTAQQVLNSVQWVGAR